MVPATRMFAPAPAASPRFRVSTTGSAGTAPSHSSSTPNHPVEDLGGDEGPGGVMYEHGVGRGIDATLEAAQNRFLSRRTAGRRRQERAGRRPNDDS